VSQVIGRRALREYPRSALRAHLEGTVLLNLRIAPSGHIENVEVVQSSGHLQLDDAALAAARALADVPAPPAPLHRLLKPIKVPLNYRLD
jgi:TonB family protein